MNLKTINLPWETAMACATSKALNPVTQWMDPAEFQKMRATMEIRNRCGANIDVAVGYQLADVENAPLNDFEIESYNGPSGWKSSNGVFYPERWDETIVGQASSRQLIRFGFMTKLSSGTALQSLRVAAKIEIFTC